MVRACRGAGAVLRPNNSLAGVAGSSGLASGGNGCGLRAPLSCAIAPEGASNAASANAATRTTIVRDALGGSIVLILAASDPESCAPFGDEGHRMWRLYGRAHSAPIMRPLGSSPPDQIRGHSRARHIQSLSRAAIARARRR